MADRNTADKSLLVSRSAARSTVGRALDLYVGRGRRYSVKQLSNATGVPDRLIEAARCDPDSTEYRQLPVEALLSISSFLGADFTAEWLSVAGQGAFDLPDDETPPAMRLAVESAQDNAKLLEMAEDNVIDAGEAREAAAIGRRKIARGMTLVAAAAKAA